MHDARETPGPAAPSRAAPAVTGGVRRGLRFGLVGLGAGVAIGGGWAATHPATWAATAVLQAAGPASEASGSIETQVRFTASPAVLAQVVNQENLAADPDFTTGPSGSLQSALAAMGLGDRPAEGRAAAAARALAERLSVRREPSSDLVEVTVRAPAPDRAAALANAVAGVAAAEWSSVRADARRQQAQRSAARIAALQTKYYESETRLVAARQNAGRMDPKAELAQARARAAEARARVEQAQRAGATPHDPEAAADGLRSPTLDRLQARVAEAARTEAAYRQTLGPRHPSMVEAQQQLREARKALADETKRILDGAREDLGAAEAAEAAAAKRAAAADSAPDQATARLRALETEVEANRAAYERALAGQSVLDEADVPSPLRLTAPAAAATAVASLDPVLATSAGAALGLLVGLALGALPLGSRRGRAGDVGVEASARSRTEPYEGLRLAPPSATLQMDRDWEDSASDAAPSTEQAEAVTGRAVAEGADGPGLFAVRDKPDGDYARAVADLAGSLLEEADRAEAYTVLVTSLAPRAGKSTLAANLARAAAKGWRRVLLVDANRRHPTLSLALGLGSEPGLLRLGGRERPIHALDGDWDQGLFFLPVDTAREGVAPALPERARLQFDGVAGHFDLIVIDGPTADGEGSDAGLAASADQVLLLSPPGQEADPNWASALLAVPRDRLIELPMAA